jgi:hypothetical protein
MYIWRVKEQWRIQDFWTNGQTLLESKKNDGQNGQNFYRWAQLSTDNVKEIKK